MSSASEDVTENGFNCLAGLSENSVSTLCRLFQTITNVIFYYYHEMYKIRDTINYHQIKSSFLATYCMYDLSL